LQASTYIRRHLPLRQFAILAHVHPFGLNRLADAHCQPAGIKMLGVDGQEIVNAAERDGNERNLRANGEVRSAGEKRPQLAV
jgi:hypothetical protein